ncbi:Serine/threonine-protein phosphatase bsl1 [Asimina triloba]
MQQLVHAQMPLSDAYGLLKHRDGRWEWTLAPGVSPSSRILTQSIELNSAYLSHGKQVFVGARLHVTGGALKGGRAIESEAAIAVLDTAAGVWLDRNGIVTSTSRSSKSLFEFDSSLELMRRCRHAAASVGNRIYLYGGLRGDVLLDDLVIADNSPFQSEINSPIATSNRTTIANSKSNQLVARPDSFVPPTSSESYASSSSMDKKSMEKLAEASAAEAEAVSAVFKAARLACEGPGGEEPPDARAFGSHGNDRTKYSETSSYGSESDTLEADVRLHPRAVVVANEVAGNLGGLLRQLSLDHFENESRRMIPINSDTPYTNKKFTRQRSPQGLHKKACLIRMIISTLLKPRNWTAPTNRSFFLDSYEVGELCYAAEQIFMQEPTVLQVKAPVKVFGDLHGQFGDLMRLFDEYGFPSTAGDITLAIAQHSSLHDDSHAILEAHEPCGFLITIEYPENIHLIRGNHEAADINALFGFRLECVERMGENDGIWAWTRFNQLFNCLPLAALIEKKIICMHGGIGRSIGSVEQIEKLERPITMDAGSIILMDLLWSDPTENDSIEGLRPNARGPGLVTFGVCALPLIAF